MIHSFLFKASGQEMVKWPKICLWIFFPLCHSAIHSMMSNTKGRKKAFTTTINVVRCSFTRPPGHFCMYTQKETKGSSPLGPSSTSWKLASVHPWARKYTHTHKSSIFKTIGWTALRKLKICWASNTNSALSSEEKNYLEGRKPCDYKPENYDYFWRENIESRVSNGKRARNRRNCLFWC